MSQGWIKLHRSLLDWEWYTDQNTSRLFIHLLLRANHKDKKWRGILIEKGQLLTGRKVLSEETGLSEQQVRSSLNKLKSTNEITIKSTKQSSVITVVAWESYQQDNQQINQQATNDQPTSNQQVTTNKNVKNDNNEKECNKKETWLPPEGLNLEAWEDYEQHRKTTKGKFSDLARTKAANVIKSLSPEEQQATIDRSIQSGWPGLFPEKSTQQDTRPFFQKNNDSVREQLFGKKKGETYEH
jgi:predicted transcriptional regulator